VRASHLARRARLGLALVAFGAVGGAPLAAQRPDSARAGVAAPRRQPRAPADSIARPPLSPRRAFLYSALLPGTGQARLERYNAGALFVAVEMASIAMAVKSRTDLRRAERLYQDSVVTGFSAPDSTGAVVATYQPCRTSDGVQQPCRITEERVRARRVHYEDWLAAILFNHLFSGADAFVAAQLWDLPAQVSANATPDGRGVTVAARVAW
jgi:hypothetical protein